MKTWLIVLSLVAIAGSLILLEYVLSRPLSDFIERPSVTVVEVTQALDAGAIQDAGSAEPVTVRPTAQQLSEKFLTWELRDLISQAETPEDKKLVEEALNLRRQRAKASELSPSFDSNMQRALK